MRKAYKKEKRTNPTKAYIAAQHCRKLGSPMQHESGSSLRSPLLSA